MDFNKLPESIGDVADILKHFEIECSDMDSVCGFAAAKALQSMAALLSESTAVLEAAQALLSLGDEACVQARGKWLGAATMVGLQAKSMLGGVAQPVFMKMDGKAQESHIAMGSWQTKDSDSDQLVH